MQLLFEGTLFVRIVQAKLRDSATARSAEFDKRCLQFLQKVPFLWFVSLGNQRNEQKTSFEL